MLEAKCFDFGGGPVEKSRVQILPPRIPTSREPAILICSVSTLSKGVIFWKQMVNIDMNI